MKRAGLIRGARKALLHTRLDGRQYDDEQRRQWPEQQREQPPQQSAPQLALRQHRVDQGQRALACDEVRVFRHGHVPCSLNEVRALYAARAALRGYKARGRL